MVIVISIAIAFTMWRLSKVQRVRYMFRDYPRRAAAWCCVETGWHFNERSRWSMLSLKSDTGNLMFVNIIRPGIIKMNPLKKKFMPQGKILMVNIYSFYH